MAILDMVGPRQSPDGTAADADLPHDDLGPELNAVFWLLTVLSLGFLSLRIYCKLARGRRLWWDDYLLIASWVALAVSASTTSVCVALDYGKHFYDMRPENLPKMPFVAVFAGFFSVLSAVWSKTAFALTLLRLSERWMKVMIWIIIITLNAIMGTAMLFMWIKCRPFALVWDQTIEGYCIPQQKIITLFQWSAGWSGSMDIILALCPWFILWNLTMTVREKFGVAIAMSMGVVAGAASFVKMVMLPKLAGDPTETVAVTIWGGAEGAITIIAASIPVLRALIQKKATSSSDKENSGTAPLARAEQFYHAPVNFDMEMSPLSPIFGKIMVNGSSSPKQPKAPKAYNLEV
ncbi:putative integral membrane protein [Lasiosphaeria hispida]|uniref:Integral membrane protein n=1 Tax=Lasiosphaeria hispida TaxID=260671 RepID=A0AAJ0M971_9PEZI|nr:putative integral membrane protein [Lasiosphaeria hispida]